MRWEVRAWIGSLNKICLFCDWVQLMTMLTCSAITIFIKQSGVQWGPREELEQYIKNIWIFREVYLEKSLQTSMHKTVYTWVHNSPPTSVAIITALLCAIWLLFMLGSLAVSSCELWVVSEIPCWGCALFRLILTLPLSTGLLLIMLSLLAESSSPSQADRCVGA